MQHQLAARIDEDIAFIDALFSRQIAIDRAIIEQMRESANYAQVWGHTLPTCPPIRIVEGTIELRDTNAEQGTNEPIPYPATVADHPDGSGSRLT